MNGYTDGNETDHQQSVCIIGAGSAGLCVAQKFLKDPGRFKVTVLEKMQDVGGQWIYTEDVNTNQYGLPVHSSVYRSLRTNLPLALMEFDDFPHKVNPSGFVRHEYILQYLKDFAKHFKIDQHIKFLHLVTRIARIDNQWSVEFKNLETSKTQSSLFDIVCLCKGRFSNPIIPTDIVGLDRFPGKILHTHTYRSAEEFQGKRVVVLGGGPSGMDVALEVSEVASELHLCHKMEQGELNLGAKVIQYEASIESIDGQTLKLTNGHSLPNIDAIIFATGYDIVLELVDPSCGIKVSGGRVEGIFMHLINMKYPTMAIFGLLEKIPPFNFFCQQAKYFVRTLTGEAKLPSYEEMVKDVEDDWRERQKLGVKTKHAHRMFQDSMWRYDQKISSLGGFPPLSPLTKSLYDKCFQLRWQQSDYKDIKFLIHSDGKSYSIIDNSETPCNGDSEPREQPSVGNHMMKL